MPDTIPGLLVAAADRDAEGSWVRADEGSLSFAGAVGQVAGLAARLREAGVRRGDLVVVTTRTTPPYLLCWLALACLGAVTVPTDPAGTVDELPGLIGQVRPRLVVTDADLVPVLERAGVSSLSELGVLDVDTLLPDWQLAEAGATPLRTGVGPDDLAVLIPTSGTTGRSKLVMQTHRAYAMAGEGFPYWMELTAEPTG